VANGPCTCSYDDVADDPSAAAEAVDVRHCFDDVRHCFDIETAVSDDTFVQSREEALASRH
jgi:hypothetical protein